jgi:hypothetical protein
VVHALTSNTPTTPSNETTRVLHLLHPPIEVDFPPFVDDFHPKTKVTLVRETFISTLACSPCLSSDGLLSMVYELLQDCFVLNDYVSGFNLFFKVCGHIAQGHVPPLVSCLLSTSLFLSLEKQFGGICPIMINEMTQSFSYSHFGYLV